MAARRKMTTGASLHGIFFVLTLMCASGLLILLTAGLSVAGEVWHVGTWKTAQTIQPFLYEKYADLIIDCSRKMLRDVVAEIAERYKKQP